MFLKKIACGLLCAAMLVAAGCGGVGTRKFDSCKSKKTLKAA